MTILTSVWGGQHLNAGQNIQQLAMNGLIDLLTHSKKCKSIFLSWPQPFKHTSNFFKVKQITIKIYHI